ncbi:MAG: anti-sigma factor family protein [Actinomycetota bacterium]
MTHPEELLAGYVDGSLSGSDRTTVDAHLQACARCRAEVRAAGTARAGLRRLPDPVAPDLSAAVTAELQGVRPPVSTAPRWYRYAGIAAAAVVALAVVVSLPKVGSGPSADREAAGTSGAAPTVGQADTLAGLALELQETDYDTAAVQALAGEASRLAPPSEAAGAGSAASVPVGTPAQAKRAQACVARAFPDFPGTPTRLISATFEGTPAYLAVVLEGPAPGQPADTGSVWVADHASCQPLSFTTARL